MQAQYQFGQCGANIRDALQIQPGEDGTRYYFEVEANTKAGRWSASKRTNGVTVGKSSVGTNLLFDNAADSGSEQTNTIVGLVKIPPSDGDIAVTASRNDDKGAELASQATQTFEFAGYAFDFAVESPRNSQDKSQFAFNEPVEICLDCTNAGFEAGQAPVLLAFDNKYGVWYSVAESCEEPHATELKSELCVQICSLKNTVPPPPCEQLFMPASKQACEKRYDCELGSGGNTCVTKPISRVRRVLQSQDANLFALFTQQEPVAALSIQTQFANVPERISMDASDSYDPNNGRITFSFDCSNDNEIVPELVPGKSDHAVVSITKGGTYEFCVTVQDIHYAQAKECKTVHVNKPPVVDGWLDLAEDGRVHQNKRQSPLQLAVAVHDPDHSDFNTIKVTWGQSQKSKSEGVLTFTNAAMAAKDSSLNCKDEAACNQATGVASVQVGGMQTGFYWVDITLEDAKGAIVQATLELASAG